MRAKPFPGGSSSDSGSGPNSSKMSSKKERKSSSLSRLSVYGSPPMLCIDMHTYTYAYIYIYMHVEGEVSHEEEGNICAVQSQAHIRKASDCTRTRMK